MDLLAQICELSIQFILVNFDGFESTSRRVLQEKFPGHFNLAVRFSDGLNQNQSPVHCVVRLRCFGICYPFVDFEGK